MPTLLIALISGLFAAGTAAAPDGADIVWRIGAADHDFHEFNFNTDQNSYARRFPKDVDYVVGKSDPAKDFSAIHPGPEDSWAGHREHAFKITFNLPEGPVGTYLLGIDLVDTHAAVPPTLRIKVNEQAAEFPLERGTGDVTLLDARKGKVRSFRFALGGDVLKAGENVITLRNFKGSWLLYDTLFLQKLAGNAKLPIEATLRPTVFFVEREGKLLQEFTLSATGLSSAEAAKLEVKAGAESLASIVLGKPMLGILNQPVHLPEAATARELTATLTAGSATKVLTVTQGPQRKWNIYVAPSTHTDIGYTDQQDQVVARHNRNTDLALDLIREFPLYHWNLESSWAAQVWFRDRPEARRSELLEASKAKRIGIESGYLNMLTGLCSGEELIRNLYYSARLHRETGIPFESCTLTDAPSHVWTVPTILAGAGIHYLSVGVNQTRAPLFKKNIHHKSPFWWEGPDGSKVLTWFSDGYSQAERIGLKDGPDRMRATLEGYLYWWEHRNDYPFDAILLHGAYSDNVAIGRSMGETLTEYHKRYAYPKVILAANNDFFEYVEKNFADKIQTVRGCGGSWWEDGAGSSAVETATNRLAHADVIAAEAVWAAAKAVSQDTVSVPQDDFNRVWDCILLYDEHTWGAYNSIGDPDSDFVTRQFAVKASYATEARDRSSRLLDSGLREIASRVDTPADSVLVFNPSGRARSGAVTIDVPRTALVAGAEGIVPQQTLHQDETAAATVAFLASDVPPAGYKTYRLVHGSAPAPAPKRFDGKILENNFYRVEFGADGAIASLTDKKLGTDLVDKTSKYKLGQVIYAAGGGDAKGATPVEAPILERVKYSSPKEAQIEAGAAGPLFSSAKSISKLPPLDRIEMEVILYENERRVDVVYRLNKKMVLEKEAVYFAFPFAGEKPQFRYEVGGGNVRPNQDQFPGACRDWFSVQRWVTVNTSTAGVIWSPVETPLITLCDMTPGKWLDELPITNGTIFAYAMNNYWFTNYKAGQDGTFTFHYSLTSDKTADAAAACQFGETVQASMRAVRVNPRSDVVIEKATAAVAANTTQVQTAYGKLPATLSLGSIQPANIELTAWKPADDGRGIIVRIHETSGHETDVQIQLGLSASRATRCDLVERDLEPATLENGQLHAHIGANGLATYRLE